MANLKEIKNRINSVKDTQKITNAMYLIASAKMRRAKQNLDSTKPYFDSVKTEIKRVFKTAPDIESPYFYPMNGDHILPGAYAYLIITADKGLAGAYNHNVIKESERLMKNHRDNKIYVVGEFGRHYFEAKGVQIEQSFLYSAQNPTMHNARKISSSLLESFLSGEFRKLFIIYTDYGNGINSSVASTRLLPFHRDNFIKDNEEKEEEFEFYPNELKVLENVMPSYITGFIYSALVDSFCCEQSARMNAMDSANDNAQELIDELVKKYNHLRQTAVTQEITEISAGARSLKNQRRLNDI